MNLGKVKITTFLMVFNHFSIDKRLPLLAKPILFGACFSLHRCMSLLDQPLPMLLSRIGYLLSDPELAEDTLRDVEAFQSLVHESQCLFIM